MQTWWALNIVTFGLGLHAHHAPCLDDYDYARAVAEVWEWQADMVIVEQDIVPTAHAVEELLACTRHFCAIDYPLADGTLWTHVQGGLGIGLAKLGARARQEVVPTPPMPLVPWWEVAGTLRDRLPPVHVHRTAVAHNHRRGG